MDAMPLLCTMANFIQSSEQLAPCMVIRLPKGGAEVGLDQTQDGLPAFRFGGKFHKGTQNAMSETVRSISSICCINVTESSRKHA